MAIMKLSKRTFSLVPEGANTFKVMEVDDSKYEDFGKISVKLQTAKGETHVETFTLVKPDGNINEGALKAWSYFARTCLNNMHVDEIDTQDVVGCYITANVKYETYTRTRGENAGTEGTSVRLSDYKSAVGFDSVVAKAVENDEENIDDLDSFLDD